jgi:4-hydroxy-2-oxoheptanedioate aldolase
MQLKEKIRSGKLIYGTGFTSISHAWPASLKKADLDFAFIDTEHISMNRADMAKLCELFTSYNIAPIVRITNPDPHLASQASDAGAIGVVAPYIEHAHQVKELVGSIKYKPLKGEKLNNILNKKETINPTLSNYLNNLNQHKLCIANIESPTGVKNLDEILAVEGLDAIFIGPHDLSVSFECPEDYDNPIFIQAAKKIIQKTIKKGIPVGIHFSLEPERQIQWIKEGANIILHSFDIALFTQKLIADLQIIRDGIGDKNEKNIDNNNIII